MTNRLSGETSPYLLQHKDNPVDWYPWGEEALSLAREHDKPILLSIGYSACHWCHVMAHESFEDPEIAALMNELFINIKVDREERPDIDSIYMMSVQMLTGQGGWPMTVFLTPDGKPFYGGTYYPPTDRGSMPGFPRVLQGVSEAYRDRREAVLDSANQLASHLTNHFEASLPPSPLAPDLIDTAVSNLGKQYDRANGGFGGAPKFPSPMSIELLLRAYSRDGNEQALQMAEYTLDRMARGGLYDQVGGGFHRYTVDAIWLVPHFEKMLYDNAQLATVYALAYQVTDEDFYRAISRETLDYVTREMTAPEGGFYSTQDADTDGEEGKFYVWTPGDVMDALGDEDGRSVIDLFAITETGNFEGANVLQIVSPATRMDWRSSDFKPLRERMYAHRQQRTIPGRDDKVLTSWNGLMMRAFATAAWVFDDEAYAGIARRNAEFLRANLVQDGKLLHTWKDGQARIDGFLEDYAFLSDGLLALYGATFEIEWLEWAVELANVALGEFFEPGTGAFYDTAASAEVLVSRPRDPYDSATPSGNSVMCQVLLQLAQLTGRDDFRNVATAVLEGYAAIASEQPHGFSRLLCAIDEAVGPSAEIALVEPATGQSVKPFIDELRDRYLPRMTVAVAREDDDHTLDTMPVFRDRQPVDGAPTAFVCVGYSCRLPVTEPRQMVEQIAEIAGRPV